MKIERLIAATTAPFLLIACGGGNEAGPAQESTPETTETAPDDAEAAKRREAMIATWGANFNLSEEQATCLVDNVTWDDMIAAEQSEETITAITSCQADPSTFAGYGQ